jgi:hypothetical protein
LIAGHANWLIIFQGTVKNAAVGIDRQELTLNGAIFPKSERKKIICVEKDSHSIRHSIRG